MPWIVSVWPLATLPVSVLEPRRNRLDGPVAAGARERATLVSTGAPEPAKVPPVKLKEPPVKVNVPDRSVVPPAWVKVRALELTRVPSMVKVPADWVKEELAPARV